jgi:prophage regulatory protein
MGNHTVEASPQAYARIGGALYLVIIVLGAFAEGFVGPTGNFRGEPAMTQTTMDAIAVGNVIRLPEVRRMTGLGRLTIYRLQADQQFPQSIKLGIRAVGWLELEVREWLATRVASSRDKQL